MSKLSQAKREAKRLLKLAQETENQINIPTLATAQKIIAHTNGYKNWHDFEVNLNKESINQEKPDIHTYLSHEAIYELKKLYVDEIQFNPSEYDKKYPNVLTVNDNEDNRMKPMGYMVEKKLFSENKKEVKYSKRNHIIIGSAGTGKSELVKNIMGDSSSSSCVYFSSYEGVNLYQKLNMSKKEMIKDTYYCSLLRSNQTYHSIDLINNLIDLEIGFKKSFQIENELLSDIFYKLSKHYRNINKALDSQDLRAFLSLKWLSSFNEHAIIESLIDKYFNTLEINKESLQEEDFFNTNQIAIQKHHQYCFIAQSILLEMKKYEEKGVFSKEAQINFYDLLKNNKHLIFDMNIEYKERENDSHKNLYHFIYLNYFYTLKDRNEFLSDNIHENIEISWGFSAVTIIEDMSMVLTAKNFNILNDLLQSFKSPFFMSDQDLCMWKSQYHSLFNHINYYVFLKSEINTHTLVPEICKKMMLTGVDNFANIASRILDIKTLDVGQCLYWTNNHLDYPYPKRIYNRNANFDLVPLSLHYQAGKFNKNNNNLIDHPIINKLI